MSWLKLFTDRRFDAFDMLLWIYVTSAPSELSTVFIAVGIWAAGVICGAVVERAS